MATATNHFQDEGQLLAAIADGDSTAWSTIMERYRGAVHGTLSGFRFDQATADDVAQTVWIKLFENVHKIRDARCLGGWLRTTTKRTAIEVTRQRKRLTFVDDYAGLDDVVEADYDIGLESSERTALCRGFKALTHDAQRLLSLVFADDPLPYADIAEQLDRPVGSLGPTRARALRQLRSNYEAEIAARRQAGIPVPVAA